MSGEFRRRTSSSLATCQVALFLVVVVTPMLDHSTSASAIQTATAERETFDSASIRERPRGSTGRPNFMPGPLSLNVTSATALDLIQYAFDIPEANLVGDLPDWVRSARFDVIAKTNAAPLTFPRLFSMLKVLLEDRFRLNASFEKATRPIYALVMARSDGAKGPQLRPAQFECLVDPPIRVPQAVKALQMSNCGVGSGISGGAIVALRGLSVTMDQLAAYLTRWGAFDRPVVNRTGLDGKFDLNANVTPGMEGVLRQAILGTILREQLGLTLRTEQGSVDVLRIHRIQRPSEN